MRLLRTMLLATTVMGVNGRAPAAERPRAEQPPTSVAWFDIMTGDLQRSEDFYSGVFGWSFAPQQDGYVLIEADGKSMGGLDATASAGGAAGSGIALYFAVDDLDATLARATALGAVVILKPMTVPNGPGRMALFADPDHNVVGLLQAGKD